MTPTTALRASLAENGVEMSLMQKIMDSFERLMPKQCSPDLTHCPRCNNNISACDGEFGKGAAGVPVAWMWQHDETGSVGFIDPWQVENGWQQANPRLKIVRPLYAAPGAPLRMLTREELDAALEDADLIADDLKLAQFIVTRFCGLRAITLEKP